MSGNDELKLTRSSGNVFEDLGFKDAKQRLAKAELASRIHDIIDERDLNQVEAAELLGINQPKVSALMNGQLTGFSMERLMGLLNKLDQDIKIVVSEKPHTRKRAAVIRIAFA